MKVLYFKEFMKNYKLKNDTMRLSYKECINILYILQIQEKILIKDL